MTYHPVEPPRQWRRAAVLRRVPWLALAWLAGTAGVTGWWAARPEVGWGEAVPSGLAFALLLGAALAPPMRRREEKR